MILRNPKYLPKSQPLATILNLHGDGVVVDILAIMLSDSNIIYSEISVQ